MHVTQEGTQIQALNVTDEIAFSWKLSLCDTMNNKEIIAGGSSAVYAVRTFDGAVPQLFVCHPDSTYTRVFLQQQKNVRHTREGRWQDLPVLQPATRAKFISEEILRCRRCYELAVWRSGVLPRLMR